MLKSKFDENWKSAKIWSNFVETKVKSGVKFVRIISTKWTKNENLMHILCQVST